MKIQTSRFGLLDVAEQTLLNFSSGLVGFPALRQFVVLDAAEDSDYQWLQSVEEPSFAFVIVDVHLLRQNFHVEIPEEGLMELELTQTDPITLMAVVTIPSGKPDQATANLRAPLAVNLRTRRGKQLILHESIPLRYPLIQVPTERQPDDMVVTESASV